MEELYNKYAGRACKYQGDTGVICGYLDTRYDKYLVMAIVNADKTNTSTGWYAKDVSKDIKIITNTDNPAGYWFVDESDIIPE